MASIRSLRVIQTQLLLLLFLGAIYSLSIVNIIPNTSEITSLLNSFFERYGVIAVASISFIENIVGLNAYFPGSVVILFAMSATHGNISLALTTFLSIYLSSSAAHIINFFIGRYTNSTNNSPNNSKSTFHNKGISTLYLTTFWHPHFTALSCLASGSEGIKFNKFIINFICFSFLWNAFWAVTMYNAGEIAKSNINFLPFIVCYIILWAIYDLAKHFQEINKTTKHS